MFNWNKKRQDPKQPNRQQQTQSKPEEQGGKTATPPDSIPPEITQCEKLIKTVFHNTSDLVVQPFNTSKGEAMIVYIDGTVNKDLIDRDILTPLKSKDFSGNVPQSVKANFNIIEDFSEVVMELLNGNVALFFEESEKVVLIDFKGWEQRAVEAPEAESVVRGPKESFNENIRTNTALIRRKIKSPDLVVESFIIGKQTRTLVGLVYIQGIVNQDVLKQVRERLGKIDTDAILESGYIEQFITKTPLAAISGVGLTQKPDVAAGRILEGRLAIFCDGTPHVLTIPELFIENIQTAEDYYNRPIHAAVIRIFRFVGLFLSVMLPGLAVAVMTYNQEMIPPELLTNIISATQKTPMPEGAELLLLMLMFELVAEAGARLPKSIGSAITIVGSLIIGDAAVSAGVVGAPTVIIVALTAVTSFIVPNLREFSLIYRFFFLFLGGTMGLVGIGAGIVMMLTQLCSTESFGVPIMSSFSKEEMKDSLLRMPLWTMKFRPASIAKENIRRQK